MKVMQMGAPAVYGIEEYSRAALLIYIDEDDFYILDYFRVVGGSDHAKFVHSGFGTMTTHGLVLSPGEDFGYGTLLRNFQRPPEELAAIFEIVEENVDRLAAGQAASPTPRRIRAVGQRELLPASTLAAIERMEAATAHHTEAELIVAVGYGGREEITDAVRRMIVDRVQRGDSLEGIAAGLTPDEIARYMYAPDVPDPDLVIRTSGELRLSGFMLWQSAYSEYYFTDAYWPEFRRIDFLRAIRSYGKRQRRLGK
jgi:short-chain Z-isoprenyl diphosphate synthase